MSAPSSSSSLQFEVTTSSLCNHYKLQQEQEQEEQQEQLQQLTTLVTLSTASATATSLSACTMPLTHHGTTFSHAAVAATSASYRAPFHDGITTTSMSNQKTPPPTQAPTQMPRLCTGNKRTRVDQSHGADTNDATRKRKKPSPEFLRKGQWTPTEERLARLLIEAFEAGRLPIYTGIRLRGYLAVQLQCDPMRVSKKLCAGTIDYKHVPRNYGQKKFKLRKKGRRESDEGTAQLAEIKRLTKTLWSEARVRKPAHLTLSSTRNVTKRRALEDETDLVSSPPSPARSRSPLSTPKAKKQKVLPIIYFHLSKRKRSAMQDDDDDGGSSSNSSSSSSSELASPVRKVGPENEFVRLDGESLQAAYDLLTLCSPRATFMWSSKRVEDKLETGGSATTIAAAEDRSCKVSVRKDDRMKTTARPSFARTT